MLHAIIENQTVVNIILGGSTLEGVECVPVGENCQIGFIWDDAAKDYIPPPLTAAPPVPVPSEVSNAQAREALIRSGISIASVNSALAAIADPVEREVAVTQWEYRTSIRRDADLVVSMAGAMNLTPAQVDDLFRLAATL